LAEQEGAWALTGELSCGTTITSAKVSIATAAGTANTRLSQAGAAAGAEPGAVVRRDEPPGGGRNLGITAFDDLRMVDTSHVEVGVEHLHPRNPVDRQDVAPGSLSDFLWGKGPRRRKMCAFCCGSQASWVLLDDLEPVNTSYGTSVHRRAHGQSLPILLGAVTYVGRARRVCRGSLGHGGQRLFL
jgi:hypothetical protein